MPWPKTLGLILMMRGADSLATIAMVIITVFGLEVIRVLVKDGKRR